MLRKRLLAGACAALLPVTTTSAGSISAFPFKNFPLTGNAATARSVDITAQGTTDWSLYAFGPFAGGNGNISSPHSPDERMLGGSGDIGDAATQVIADGTPGGGFTSVGPFANDGAGGYEGALNFEWSNGTNSASGLDHSVLVIRGGRAANESIEIDVEADGSLQRAWIYVTSFATATSLELSLSDGSAPSVALTDLFGAATLSDSIGLLRVDFMADTPGAMLELSLTEGDNIREGTTAPSNFRSFGVAAIALGEVPEPASAALLGCLLTSAAGVRRRRS